MLPISDKHIKEPSVQFFQSAENLSVFAIRKE